MRCWAFARVQCLTLNVWARSLRLSLSLTPHLYTPVLPSQLVRFPIHVSSILSSFCGDAPYLTRSAVQFPLRELASFVASKCYFHLEEYDGKVAAAFICSASSSAHWAQSSRVRTRVVKTLKFLVRCALSLPLGHPAAPATPLARRLRQRWGPRVAFSCLVLTASCRKMRSSQYYELDPGFTFTALHPTAVF
jgi:hypothetical protein